MLERGYWSQIDLESIMLVVQESSQMLLGFGIANRDIYIGQDRLLIS